LFGGRIFTILKGLRRRHYNTADLNNRIPFSLWFILISPW